MSEYIQPDFMYQFHLFEIGETVQFTQAVRTINYAFRKKNQFSHTIRKGTRATVIGVKEAGGGMTGLTVANYKVRLSDGRVIDIIPEYVLEAT